MVDLSYVNLDGQAISAMPLLETLLALPLHLKVEQTLQGLSTTPWLFDNSLSHVRGVLRVPLKPSPVTEAEAVYLKSSFDGLGVFKPVDIYPHNIVSTGGLLQVLAELQSLDGFGRVEHSPCGLLFLAGGGCSNLLAASPTLLLLLWMAPVRQDQFLLFGLWHPYHYAPM